MSQLENTFLALIAVQGAHSVEEYSGRLWEDFPPARFVVGLVSEDPQLGFIIVNVALFVFGVWCFIFPVRRHWPSAKTIIGAWIVIEFINGIGHPLWSMMQAGYTPGLITAPVLLILALSLAWQIRNEARPPSLS